VPQEEEDEETARNSGTNLFVTGIHPRLTEGDVARLFEKYGEVEKCNIMRDPHTRESRGFGFVNFFNSQQADAAKEALQGEVYEGRTLSIEKARRSKPRTPTPGKYFVPPKRGKKRWSSIFVLLLISVFQTTSVVAEVVVATVTDWTTDVEAAGMDVEMTTAPAPVDTATAKREATEAVAIVTMALVSTVMHRPVMTGMAEAVEKDATITRGMLTVPLPQLQVVHMLNLLVALRSTRADLMMIVPMTGTPVVKWLH